MVFSVQTLPNLAAAEEWLTATVGAAQHDALQRVNVLTGSNLQRIHFRRRLAQSLGATANVRFFTPIDLAVAIRQVSPGPAREPLPDGGDTLLLDTILSDLQVAGRLRRLDPRVQGVVDAVAGSLTDLREGAISPTDYAQALRRGDDPKLHDLSAIYGEFAEQMASFSDRSSLYEDALDPRLPNAAVAAALGGAPLLVIGIYDAPSVQVQLLARCADVADVSVALVAPADADFAFAFGFRDALAAAGAAVSAADDDTGDFDHHAAYSYFSAPSRQAEAEEIVRRILALARDHDVPFNEMAVLHRLDPAQDDLLGAALERAQVPLYRAAGRPLRHSAAGRAVLVLLELLLQTPQRPRLLELFASPALAATIPPGVRAKPVLWERHSKQAGIVQGWDRFQAQLHEYARRLRDEERSDHAIRTAEEIRDVVRELHAFAKRLEDLTTWSDYCSWFVDVLDAYLAPGDDGRHPLAVARNRIGDLARLDRIGVAVDHERFRAAAARSVRRAVLNDAGPLTQGVFVGNVSAARSLRFTAVFLAECAERIFPPLIRQDPLLLDGERERLNQRLRRTALPLKRSRQDEEQMLFRLVEQSATRFLTISWARRTNTTGAPKLESPFLLRSIPTEIDELATVEELYEQGVITKLPSRLAGAAPSATAIAAGDWSSLETALDPSDFCLGVLEASGPGVARRLLPQLWDGYRRYEKARLGRNGEHFSVWDGLVPADALSADPLARTLSATALEEYATCPYRYYMKQVLRVGAVPEPGEALEMTPLDRGTMVHRILERWVTEALAGDRDWATFLEDETRLMAVAEEEFDRERRGGLAGLPATWAIVQAEVVADLRELIRIERARAARGFRPIDAEWEFPPLTVLTPDGEELTFRGRIDRIDQGPDGLVAIDYKTGRASKSADDYRSGAALQLPIYLQAVAQKHEVDPASVEAEYWYATRRGDFVRSGLRGADVLSDEQFWEALRVIRDGIRQGRFFPHPGEARGNRRRPNCTYCDYFSVCSTDVDARFDHKKRLDQPVVREFLSLQARK